MYYCVRCGDKIDKDEAVCDKCGLRFRVVQNDGTTVYINQSPTPKNKPVKKKKKVNGWLIALLAFLGTSIVGIAAAGILLVGLIVGLFIIILLIPVPEEDPIIVNTSMVDQYQPTTVIDNINNEQYVVTYDNEIANSEEIDPLSAALRDPYVTLKGDGTDQVTVMVYMIGSNLESQNGYATSDLKEMLNAKLSDNVNVVVQTGGTKRWKTSGISNKHSQRFLIKDGQLVLIDDSLEQLDFTKEETLEDFIRYCSDNYPANRNILILWNHGGGVVYGYGVDEIVNDEEESLTIDEIQRATKNAGVKFEMIGFDACLMGGLETVCALSDVSDYLVISEDFESGYGWEYQNWLSILGYNSSTPMNEVGKIIVDDYVKESYAAESEGVLALVDLRYSRLLFNTWTKFAYENTDDLLANNYSMSMERSNRAPDYIFKKDKRDFWDWFFVDDYTMENYCYAVDIMALASTMDTEESRALEAAMKLAIVYCATTSGDSYMTGLSVTLPYGDEEFYEELETVFVNCGFDSDYISFLYKFVADDASAYEWDMTRLSGWSSYNDSEEDNSDWYYYDWNDYDWEDYSNSEYDWDDYEYDDWNDWYFEDDYYDSYYDSYYDDYYDDYYDYYEY